MMGGARYLTGAILSPYVGFGFVIFTLFYIMCLKGFLKLLIYSWPWQENCWNSFLKKLVMKDVEDHCENLEDKHKSYFIIMTLC